MKICSQCGEDKPDSEYYLRYGKLRAACKSCTNTKMKEWEQSPQGKAKKRELRLAYVTSNKNTVADYIREYTRRNREIILERRKKYFKRHPEKRKVWDKRYRKGSGRELLNAYSRCRMRRRKELDYSFTLSMEKALREAFENRCCVTHETNEDHIARTGSCLSIDHIEPVVRGHKLTFENACLVSREVNSKKGARGAEFYTSEQLQHIRWCQGKAIQNFLCSEPTSPATPKDGPA